ncbi:MAG: ATP-binding protein, partial [Polyangiaceae bacterium]|nr:ATP-binding protein [Polyangiaceae bacterium]
RSRPHRPRGVLIHLDPSPSHASREHGLAGGRSATRRTSGPRPRYRSDGHGFGLYICANYVKQMGGTITVQSEGAGRGAVFTVALARRAVSAMI